MYALVELFDRLYDFKKKENGKQWFHILWNIFFELFGGEITLQTYKSNISRAMIL